MTLRKKETDIQPEFDPAEVIKMEKFTKWIEELAVYLGAFKMWDSWGNSPEITNIYEYDKRIVNNDRTRDDCRSFEYHSSGYNFLCVTGNNGKISNPYYMKAIEVIFPAHNFVSRYIHFGHTLLPYGCNVEGYGWNDPKLTLHNKINDKQYRINVWRNDLQFSPNCSKQYFNNVLKSIDYFAADGYSRTWWVKYYNIFWNLFVIAIDDDAYNEQLSNVIELADYWDFDEPMMRDWCRAVEYVLAGNKLSEDCDLACETVEGARFFLHKKE